MKRLFFCVSALELAHLQSGHNHPPFNILVGIQQDEVGGPVLQIAKLCSSLCILQASSGHAPQRGQAWLSPMDATELI